MITLKHDIVIDVSPNNYTLMLDRHKQDKKGNPLYEILGYYTSLVTAIRSAREYYIRKRLGEEVLPLHEAIEEVRRITDEFEAMLDKALGVKGEKHD